MPLLRTAVIIGVAGLLVAPGLALGANYRPQPSTRQADLITGCLARSA